MQQYQPGGQLSKSFENCKRSKQSDRTFYLHVFAITAVDAVGEIPLGAKVIPYPGKCFFCWKLHVL
jgi:hypothetical protein